MPDLQSATAAHNQAANGVARYCYSCRCQHPPGHPMRRVNTPCGVRWRCRESIEAARRDVAAREAWGRTKTEANKLRNRRSAEHLGKPSRQGSFA